MRAKTTISQIAEKCKVSVSTVSIVLNNKPGVSDSTRNQILQMAEKMGYEIRSKPRQGSLPQRKLNTLGMLVKTDNGVLPPANPFYSQIINGVDEACKDLGMNILFSMLPVDESNRPDKVPNFIKSNMADGFLMVGTFLDETVSAVLNKWNVPIVLVDGYSDTESYDMVISDNFRAAYQAVEHLIAQGHKHIGLLGGEPNCYPSLQERRNGYFRAMKEHGLQTYSADFTINSGNFEERAKSFLRENPQVTAIFGINDNIAVSTIRAAQALGIKVPNDLSVIGYDDTHLATSLSPALTTMHVDTVAMGYGAVHLLSMRKHRPDAARVTLVVHPTLVERQSVAKPCR
ncbi:MAG: LacI family DNA-binding transcriptional regulator [Anaerolineales bacterium]